MTDHAGLLLAIAQISIAFAGFSGVIAAFSKFRLHQDVTVFRVRLMVGASLSGLLFSLLPFVPMQYGASETASWRIAAGFMAATGFVFPFVALGRARKLYKAGLIRTQAFSAFTNVGSTIITLSLAAVALGFLKQYAAAIYVTALYFTLILCSFYFLMQMLAIDLDKSD
jgi:hypothetical protein